eukprot:3681672-Pyramimonas_sp.AAC.1
MLIIATDRARHSNPEVRCRDLFIILSRRGRTLSKTSVVIFQDVGSLGRSHFVSPPVFASDHA